MFGILYLADLVNNWKLLGNAYGICQISTCLQLQCMRKLLISSLEIKLIKYSLKYKIENNSNRNEDSITMWFHDKPYRCENFLYSVGAERERNLNGTCYYCRAFKCCSVQSLFTTQFINDSYLVCPWLGWNYRNFHTPTLLSNAFIKFRSVRVVAIVPSWQPPKI